MSAATTGIDQTPDMPGSRPVLDLDDGGVYTGEIFGAYRWMRAHEPLFLDAGGVSGPLYAATTRELIMTCSADTETFSNAGGITPQREEERIALPMMIEMDPPLHIRRRKLVNSGFTPRSVREMADRVRHVCDDIIDAVCERGECDFVNDVAAHLPLIMIADMLGFPESDREELLELSDDLMKGVSGTAPPEIQERAGLASLRFRERLIEQVGQRRSEAGDDLLSKLVLAEVEGDQLSDDDIFYEALLILIGGDETSRHVISGGMHQMLAHPDQWQALLADRSGLTAAIEEMLRWVTPIKNMMRTVAKPTELGGVGLVPGDRVMLAYASANRDETVWEDPYVFDSTRVDNPHIAFGGHGAHYCLGNNLARLEMQVMIETVLDRLPDLQLATDEPLPLRPSYFVSGFETMPVTFSPSSPVNR